MRCALCNRPVFNPAALIGQLPIGPRCARKAGLVKPTRRRFGGLSLFSIRFTRPAPHANLKLFEENDA